MPTRRDLQDFTANSSLIHTFRCPHLTEEYSIAIPIYDGIVTFIVLASFANATLKDPGIIPRGRDFFCQANLNYISIEAGGADIFRDNCYRLQ